MLAEHALLFAASEEMGLYDMMFPMHVSRKIGVYVDCLCQQPIYAYSIGKQTKRLMDVGLNDDIY